MASDEPIAKAEVGKSGTGSLSRRTKIIILAVIGTVVVLGLALGLGLGLGLNRDGDGGDDGDDTSGASTTTVAVSPTATPTSTPSGVWQPPVNAQWQIVLLDALEINASSPAVKPDVGVFDIDMFDHQNLTVVESLQKLGKKVICYFSAGSYEPGRPDSSDFQDADLGSELDGWPGERWLNLSSPSVREIMLKRIGIASDMGCDAIDPDNVDGYQNDNGLGLTANDSINYVRWMAGEAANLKLGIGLKNAGGIIPDVLDVIQFSVNEQCNQYDECDTFAAFIEAGKPVFNIEYPSGAPDDVSASSLNDSCGAARSSSFSTVIKDMDLDGWVEFCNGTTAQTAVSNS